MQDINGNIVREGDTVLVLTTPRSGSRSKRLFHAVAVDVHPDKNTGKFRCYENDRIVSVTPVSVVVPKE